jgi:hypothetical protein
MIATITRDGPKLGAVIGMCGWLPFKKRIMASLRDERPDEPSIFETIQALNMVREIIKLPALPSDTPEILQTPIWIGHGTADAQVRVKLGEEIIATLCKLGFSSTTWVPYKDFYHWYKEPEEIDDIFAFLEETVGLESALAK